MREHKGISAYLRGMIRFEVIGGLGERFLNICAQNGLVLAQITATPTGYLAKTTVADYKKMHVFARKNRCRLRMREKYGARFALWAYRSRFGIAIGAALCVFLLCACRSLVWSIDFAGAKFTGAEQATLRRQLMQNDIYEGAFVTQKQLEKAQSALFIDHADYGWAKLNFIKGRVMVEKTIATKKPVILPTDVTNVVATADGIVQKAEVSSGFLRVNAGQAVAQGQVLVSGMNVGVTKLPYYTHAEAKIFAEIERTYEITQPYTVQVQLPQASLQLHRTGIALGRKIPLYKAENAPIVSADALQSVRLVPLTLWGFHLPACIEEIETRETKAETLTYSPEMAREIALMKANDAFSQDFQEHRLLTQSVTFTQTEDAQMVRVRFTAIANIAKTVPFAQ
ncbi:MAG: sporulation protein YqfD [Ruthenibacterium sp.]